MSAQVFTRQGTRFRLFRTYGSRWSKGKVHLQLWSKEHRQWVVVCKPDTGPFSGYHGTEDVDLADVVTCKLCLKSGVRP